MTKLSRHIILASQSPQRKAILDTLYLPFDQIPAEIDEGAISADTEEKRCELIARSKAEVVLEKNPESIVIAADTYSVLDGRPLEKPRDNIEAKEMLKLLSGSTATTLTGFCYLDELNSIDESLVVSTEYTFRSLSGRAIDEYVANNPVTTWSAAFSPAYDSGIGLIESVNGPLSSFTHGLPLGKVVFFLKKSGIIV